MTKQLISEISLFGIIMDAAGGLYLSYDLLGGKRGPLRILARAVTYSLFFGTCYRIALGPIWGLIAGIGLGTALALESAVIVSQLTEPAIRMTVFALYRASCIGLAGALAINHAFGIAFGSLSFLALLFVYFTGLAPVRIFSAIGKPKITRDGVITSASRAAAIGSAAVLAGFLAHSQTPWQLGLVVGCAVGIVSLVASMMSPLIEWWIDNLPVRTLGAFGAALVVLGFALQAIQYLVIMLKIPIRG